MHTECLGTSLNVGVRRWITGFHKLGAGVYKMRRRTRRLVPPEAGTSNR